MKTELLLEGLHCAGCAAKIEDRVAKLEGVTASTLNFATSTLSIDGEENKLEDILDKAEKIVNDLEPHVKVLRKSNNEKNTNEYTHTNKSNEDDSNNISLIVRLLTGIAFFTIALFIKNDTIKTLLFLISYVSIGHNILATAAKNIMKKQLFDENFLMSIASIAAFALGEHIEAVMVMLLYEVGEYLQDKAVASSRKSINNLMDIRPDFANLKLGESIKKVSPTKVQAGNIIVILPGEKIPLDGEIIAGNSSLDTKALTGEAIPRDMEIGENVLSGYINLTGVLTVKVTKNYSESTASKILDMVQNASSKKAKTEKFITKFAKYYTPAVVILALLIALVPPIFAEGAAYAAFPKWIYRAATFLVVSCPCALVISIPLGYFGGIGAASKDGILIKGGNYLDSLTEVTSVVFDKTGTLTKGVFKVKKVVPSESFDENTLLRYTAHAESFSKHPVALAVLEAFSEDVIKENVKNYKEIAGKGISAFIENKKILCGNKKFMEDNNITITEIETDGTVVFTAVDGMFAGYIVIKDELKVDAHTAIKELKTLGVDNVVMLTGDRQINASKTAKLLKLDKFYSELLPQEKVSIVEKILKETSSHGKVVFVGDGINDAPVLARADIGVAMGAIGSDAAIEAADIVIMNDEPSKLSEAIKTARITKLIVTENIIFSLGIKFSVLALAAFGFVSMPLAVFADVGVAIIAVFNSMRVLNK